MFLFKSYVKQFLFLIAVSIINCSGSVFSAENQPNNRCPDSLSTRNRMCRFDMGTPGSPVRVGYTQVYITDIYSPECSFGWSRVASTAFDRTETLPYWLNWGDNNPKRTDKKIPHWAPINLLTRDGIQDPDAIEFRIDVPDGDYWVRVTCGDPFRSCMHLYWSINGDTVLHNLETRTGWGGICYGSNNTKQDPCL